MAAPHGGGQTPTKRFPGLAGVHVDHPGLRIAPIQRRLRPPQNLHPFHAAQVRREALGTQHRYAIHHQQGGGGIGGQRRAQPPHRRQIQAGLTERLEPEPRGFTDQSIQVGQVMTAEAWGLEHRHGRRHPVRRFFHLVGGHGHRGQLPRAAQRHHRRPAGAHDDAQPERLGMIHRSLLDPAWYGMDKA